MHSYYINALVGGYSISVAFIICLIKFKKIPSAWRPFFYVICLALLNEIVSMVMSKKFGSNAATFNSYSLAEFLLFLWLFKNWGIHHRRKMLYLVFLFTGVILWVADNLIINRISHFNSLFLIWYSFALVFLSVDLINYLLVSETKSLLRNSQFIICIAVVIFYSYQALFELFYLIEFKAGKRFYELLLFTFNCVNLVANILYAVAALWIPTKQKFTLSYY